jgi:hypothetical protein
VVFQGGFCRIPRETLGAGSASFNSDEGARQAY